MGKAAAPTTCESATAAVSAAGRPTIPEAVRTLVVLRQLRGHLPDRPAEVVDLGAGPGHLGLRLARAGHHVTLVDVNRSVLQHAARILAGQPREVADRVRLVTGRVPNIVTSMEHARYAVVMAHALLPMLGDAEGLFATLADLAAPGATVSVISRNPATLPGTSATAAAPDSTRGLRGHGIEELTRAATTGGWGLDAWFGVPGVPDDADDPALGFVARVRRADHAGRTDPTRGRARQLHVIGRRIDGTDRIIPDKPSPNPTPPRSPRGGG